LGVRLHLNVTVVLAQAATAARQLDWRKSENRVGYLLPRQKTLPGRQVMSEDPGTPESLWIVFLIAGPPALPALLNHRAAAFFDHR